MRNLVILFIAGVAGFLAYSWFREACPGGVLVRDETACRASFDAAFCRAAFAKANEIARGVGPAFASQTDCLDRWSACFPHGPGGMQWGPRPTSWCVARDDRGAARIEPQYDAGR